MALRALTDDERESLKNDALYLQKVQWAVRNYANFWSANDGSGANTEVARIKWAKDRILGVQIEINDIQDQNLALNALKASKGLQIDLAPAPVPAETIIEAMVSSNKFEEVAGLYMATQYENINMNVGQN
jgi:hypothetical protein